MHMLYSAAAVPAALMNSASSEQDMLCRVIGRCRHGAAIDSEIGDLLDARAPLAQRHFTYLRYNPALHAKGLEALGLPDIDVNRVRRLDAVSGMDDLLRIGERYAERQIRPEHLAGFV
jgi:hypothetical protein